MPSGNGTVLRTSGVILPRPKRDAQGERPLPSHEVLSKYRPASDAVVRWPPAFIRGPDRRIATVAMPRGNR